MVWPEAVFFVVILNPFLHNGIYLFLFDGPKIFRRCLIVTVRLDFLLGYLKILVKKDCFP